MASMSQIDLINKKTYSSFQAVRQYGRASGWLDKGEENAVKLAFDFLSNCDILDIGIGGGRTTPLLKQFSNNYIGIDYTSKLIDIASVRFPNDKFKVMDARKLAFEDRSFSYVMFSNNGIDSVRYEDRDKILSEVYRVLKPLGWFVFSALNNEHPTPTNTSYSFLKKIIAGPLEFYNKQRLKNLQIETAHISQRSLNAHFNGLLATFLSIEMQQVQLRKHSFVLQEMFDPDGNIIDKNSDTKKFSYIHYVAQKI